MSRYINTAEIDENYQKLKVQEYGDINAVLNTEQILNLTIMAIDMCKTADVVEVVRCKDCIHCDKYVYWCDIRCANMSRDSFCDCGVKDGAE